MRSKRRAESAATVRNGLVWIGALLVIGGIVGFVALRSANEKEAARQALAEKHAALRSELLAENALTPEHAGALLQRIAATRADWRDGPDRAAIERQEDQAKALVAASAARGAVADELAAVQRDVATAKGADALRAVHDRAVALAARGTGTDAATKTEIQTAVFKASTAWFDALLAQAEVDAKEPAKALSSLTTASDLATDTLADKHLVDRGEHTAWAQRVHAATQKLDAAQKAAFGDAAIAAVAWQDVKANDADWVTNAGGGVERHAGAGELALASPASEKPHSAVVVLRHHSWHACSLSFDARLDDGRIAVFPRTETQFAEKKGDSIVLATVAAAGQIALPAGLDVHVELTVVGDRVVGEIGTTPPTKIDQKITDDVRRGSIGCVVHSGTHAVMRHLRVRPLG
ncbi:MAG: hypothetical protein JNK78_14260 [Planctomycetes bacterium]|nr:hypothetical protein [Planctomycetota bacterium]